MTTVRVRFIVNDLDTSVKFYTTHLGFQVRQQSSSHIAMLSRNSLELILSSRFAPGGAAKAVPDEPMVAGDWNRLILNVDDLAAEVARLREAHVPFRSDIANVPGGSEIVLHDPSGNLVELFQPLAVTASDDEEAIRALEDQFVAALNAGDIDAIMKNYIPDRSLVVFDVVPRKDHLGAEAYRKNWMDFFSHFKGKPTITITDLSITVDGSVAFSHSFQRVTGTAMQGHSIDRTVRVTDGYRKIVGKWLIVLEHISVPVDLATGKADLNTKP